MKSLRKDVPATLLDSSWPLLARPGCPKIGSGAAFGRPKAAPSASGRVPETVLGVRDGPRSIFLRFWGDLARIFVNFRTSFRRFSLEPSATKRQIRKLKKESCGPHRPTWLLRCAVASCCSYVFRSDRRTLHVRPCVIAYPQAHLVEKYTKTQNATFRRIMTNVPGIVPQPYPIVNYPGTFAIILRKVATPSFFFIFNFF